MTDANLNQAKEIYIGDGVYALFSGYDVCLRTNRNGNWEEIYLEPNMIKLLHDEMFSPSAPKEGE